MERVACYCRVSTDEQSRHGLSLPEQEKTLKEYANEHNMQVVDTYVDAGISARKRYTKRPELLRLLGDVEKGLINMILFVKLDRWFRNVADYYEVQKILDAHDVTWRAILEDYETETASGRFKVNIMLSVAQDEADRTSERIKFVFDGKRSRNEPTNGKMPKGYKLEGKSVVKDPETAPQVRSAFEMYWETGKPSLVIDSFPDLHLDYFSLRRMLINRAYIGEFEGIRIPPIISEDEYEKTQKMRESCNVKKTNVTSTYLFTGLLHCPECGARLAAYTEKRRSWSRIYYSCPAHAHKKGCSNQTFYKEDDIEEYLLSHIESKITATITAERKSTSKSYKAQRDAINKKISKLQDLYIGDMISLEDYKSRYESLMVSLNEVPPDEPKIDTNSLKMTFQAGWKEIYNDLPREGKRLFWRKTLSSITMSEDSVADFSFAKNTC